MSTMVQQIEGAITAAIADLPQRITAAIMAAMFGDAGAPVSRGPRKVPAPSPAKQVRKKSRFTGNHLERYQQKVDAITAFLAKAPEPVTKKEIAKALGVDVGEINSAIVTMSANHLVRCKGTGRNARYVKAG